MSNHVILCESDNGSLNGKYIEICDDGKVLQFSVLSTPSSESPSYHPTVHTAWIKVQSVLAETFLPTGYPHSVRKEYLVYQLWDALQGLSSYLRSVLTTRAVLAGIGVGSSSATPLSAAMTWVLRDGCGMIGGLVIAYSCSTSFEVYTKEWRLFADFLNNFGLTMDLLSSIHDSKFFVPIILLSTLSKAGCGLIAGATKARISAHFAIKGHLADVAAKESTQETAIALVGLILGSLLAWMVGDSEMLVWACFLFLLCLHQFANYRLIKVLVFNSLNPQRSHIIVSRLIEREDADISPDVVSSYETLWSPMVLMYRQPALGATLEVLTLAENLQQLVHVWRNERFIIAMVKDRLTICMRTDAEDLDIIKAYMISTYAMGTSRAKLLNERNDAKLQVVVHELLAWFDGIKGRLVQAGWDLQDCSTLGARSYRFEMKKHEAGSKKHN